MFVLAYNLISIFRKKGRKGFGSCFFYGVSAVRVGVGNSTYFPLAQLSPKSP